MKKLTKTLLIVGGALVASEALDIFGQARAFAVAKETYENYDLTPEETIEVMQEGDILDSIPNATAYNRWKCRTIGKMAEGLHEIFFG